MITLILLVRFNRSVIISVFTVILLGLKSEFIEASVLPDVFSLHGMFIASMAYFYLFKRNYPVTILLFIVSLTNHHTTVLLFPCVLHCLWESKNKSIPAIFFGSMLLVLFYVSLLFLNHSHPLSWNDLNGPASVIKHFLRSEYGTFKLASGIQNRNFGIDALMLLLNSLWGFLVLMLPIVFLSLKEIKDKHSLIWLSSILVLLVFPLMMNIDPSYVGREILERFHLMPLICIVSFGLYLLSRKALTKNHKIVLTICSLPLITINLSNLSSYFSLRNDSIIEEYSKTLLENGKRYSPSIIVANSDTSYFGIRYLQAFENDHKTMAVSLPLFFHEWYSHKIQEVFPQFAFPRKPIILKEKKLNQDLDLFLPNISKISFIVTKDYRDGTHYKLTFLNLGRVLQEGHGIYFQSNERQRPEFILDEKIHNPQNFTKHKLYYEYTHYYLAKAANLFESNKEEAIRLWEESIKIVPYAYPPMVNLCEQFPDRYAFCKNLDEIQKTNNGYY